MTRVVPRARAIAVGGSVLALPVFGLVDYATGYEFSFSLFYLMPIAVAVWYGGVAPGLVLSVASAATWGVAEVLSGNPYSSLLIYFWNSMIRLGFFTIVTLLIADRRKLLAKSERLARVDPLTGLANSRHFYEIMDAELRRCRRYGHVVSLAYIDLDDFKQVNDTAGHAAGDELLRAVGTALAQNIRGVDTAARLGGDEFAILLPEADAEAAKAAAHKIHSELAAAVTAAGFPITSSIGVVSYGTAPASREELLRAADGLMYSVKHRQKNAVTCLSQDRSPSNSE